jgi:hypothetical protein
VHLVWAAVYGAVVTVNDSAPPTLGTPTGSLWGAGEGGVHKGIESVTVAAEDVGGGVRGIALFADSRQMASFPASCDFTFAQPCPGAVSPQTLGLPTTQLPDGPHTIEIIATDAAGNVTVQSERIVVQNASPLAAPPLTTAPPHDDRLDQHSRHGVGQRAYKRVAERPRVDRARERTIGRQSSPPLHRQASRPSSRIGRAHDRASSREPHGDLQARPANRSACVDSRERETRSRAPGDEHAAAALSHCGRNCYSELCRVTGGSRARGTGANWLADLDNLGSLLT